MKSHLIYASSICFFINTLKYATKLVIIYHIILFLDLQSYCLSAALECKFPGRRSHVYFVYLCISRINTILGTWYSTISWMNELVNVFHHILVTFYLGISSIPLYWALCHRPSISLTSNLKCFYVRLQFGYIYHVPLNSSFFVVVVLVLLLLLFFLFIEDSRGWVCISIFFFFLR